MNCISRNSLFRLALTAAFCLMQSSVWGLTTIHVETAGTLSTLLSATDKELKVTGVINGTDIKHLRQLVTAGTVTSLDWSEVRIVSGGQAYSGSFTTQDDIVGEEMFYECSKLQQMVLPQTVTAIKKNAFARTGLTSIDIPSSVRSVGEDAFAYCSSLATVVIGKKVTQLSKGTFWSSNVKNAYVKPATPPAPQSYLFGSSPKIYVYSESLADYRTSSWKNYGTIYGGLENTYPVELDPNEVAGMLCGDFFEDAACTQLKAEYQAMSDEELTAALTAVGMPDFMVSIAIKIKNQTWASYEQDFRIHDYKPYSDANYWNDKMMSSGGSYMGNPTGIYAQNDGDEIYVFVDDDVPSGATLYLAGCVDNQLVTNAKTGTKLTKGLNIIDGTKNALYYVVYVADTKSMTKTLGEWPDIKIHIEGGKVNGYYDISRHSDAEYKALRNASTLGRFTIRGEHSLFHLKTASFKTVFPNTIDKSICWFDSVAVWEKDLMGMTEAVATGKKAGYPWYLTGGEAIYPLYYNNPNFAIEGEPEDAGYANSTPYRTSYNGIDCIRNCLNALNPNMDDWCAGHECGHNNQRAINVEGCTEASNNVFSNLVRYLDGLNASGGSTLATVMDEFARRVPFYFRDVNSRLRMYWDFYLYYHLGQKNTSFYPELFKALRKDPLTLYNASNNNSGGLKFVRKVCDVAKEDLTDFFNIWGFFEPIKKGTKIEDYGMHDLTVLNTNITSTKNYIAKYEKKNREIIFVEDRADYVPSTGFLTPVGQQRNGSDQVGQCGDLGQFWDYWAENYEPSEYGYLWSDSLFAFEGSGGLGFLMLDADDNIKFAANAKNICIPSIVGKPWKDFTIYSYDADGSLHEVKKLGGGTEIVNVPTAGRLQATLTNDQVIKLVLTGRINATDIKYMRQLINESNLLSIDLTDVRVVAGGRAYYQSYVTSSNNMGNYCFHGFKKLASIKLPETITAIGSNAFSRSGIKQIVIPDKVTSVGGDAFAYCDQLNLVLIGKGVKTMDQGVFYSTPAKEVYIKATTPPTLTGVAEYLFTDKNRTIHVYESALSAYKDKGWDKYGTLVGDLTDEMADGIEAIEADQDTNDAQTSVFGDATYDLMGRRVTELKPGGIYIRGGKKFMMTK